PRRWTSSSGGSASPSSACKASSCLSARGIAMTPDPPFLALLQFADGLFPAGGFAHSFGLETYAQEGRVRDRVGLEEFVRAHLEGSAGPCDAVAVTQAARGAAAGEVAGLIALDEKLDAMKCVPEFRAASRQMG